MSSSKFSGSHFGNQNKSWFSQIIKWISKNKKIAAGAAIAVVLAVVVLVVVLTGIGKKDQPAGAVEGQTEEVAVPDEPLEENAHPEVNELIERYYKALAEGDIDTIVASRDKVEETEQILLKKKSGYIEEYRNLTSYTKKGLLENTYLVFVYYELKFKDIETPAPALNTLYVCSNEQGELYIYGGEVEDKVSNYLNAIYDQDDVEELFNRVEVSYKEAIGKDEVLDTFLEEFLTRLKTEVAVELAAESSGVSANEAEQPADTNVSGNEAEQPADTTVSGNEQTGGSGIETVNENVKAIDTVNVRSSDSESADKLGKVDAGTVLKRLETRANGWSKVEFNGKEAFVKSEFLEKTDEPVGGAAAPADTNQAAEGQSQGNVTIKETVNVRKSASETADKLGVAYQGDHYELIMKQADGWTKINYKGQTGYVKSEFIE